MNLDDFWGWKVPELTRTMCTKGNFICLTIKWHGERIVISDMGPEKHGVVSPSLTVDVFEAVDHTIDRFVCHELPLYY